MRLLAYPVRADNAGAGIPRVLADPVRPHIFAAFALADGAATGASFLAVSDGPVAESGLSHHFQVSLRVVRATGLSAAIGPQGREAAPTIHFANIG